MGSFQASERKWGIGTTLKRSKGEHNSYEFGSLENSGHLQGEKTLENSVSAKKCNQEPAGFFVFFFKGPEKRKEKRVRGENTPRKRVPHVQEIIHLANVT